MKDNMRNTNLFSIKSTNTTKNEFVSQIEGWNFPEQVIVRYIFDELPENDPQKSDLESKLRKNKVLIRRHDSIKHYIEDNGIKSPEEYQNHINKNIGYKL